VLNQGSTADVIWINTLDLEDEFLLSAFQNLEFTVIASCVQLKFLLDSYSTPANPTFDTIEDVEAL